MEMGKGGGDRSLLLLGRGFTQDWQDGEKRLGYRNSPRGRGPAGGKIFPVQAPSHMLLRVIERALWGQVTSLASQSN